MPRAAISLRVKLAAALLQSLRDDGTGRLVRVIPHEQAKGMTADQIIAAFDMDHDPIPKAHGGPDEPWNLTPRLRADHRAKTAKQDIPAIAKTKRLRRSEQEFRDRLLAKDAGEDPPPPRRAKRKIPSRPFNRKGKTK